MATRKPPRRRKAAPKIKDFLVLTSSCGDREQATFYGEASTVEAGKKMAEEAINSDDGYGSPEFNAVYVVQVLHSGKRSGVTWDK